MTLPLLLELTSNMGVTLLKIQNAERVLKQCITWVGADPDMTLQGLEAREEKLSKRTIGQLIELFRKKVEFKNGYEEGLETFLKNRNKFAHDFLSVPGIGIKSETEIAAGIDFLRELANQADLATKVFSGMNQMLLKQDVSRDLSAVDEESFNEVLALMFIQPKS